MGPNSCEKYRADALPARLSAFDLIELPDLAPFLPGACLKNHTRRKSFGMLGKRVT